MIQPKTNVLLAPYTTFSIGGPADIFIVAHAIDELIEAVSLAKEKKMPYFILGLGANILVGDKGFRGVVIKNEAKNVDIRETVVFAESGVIVGELINKTLAKGLSGFEHYAGIPSTVGGALWQNLHFLSPDRTKTVYLGDSVIEAEIFTEEGKRKTVGKDYFSFGYDWSSLHEKKDVVLSASFQVTNEAREELEKRVFANLSWRDERHPKDAVHRSAGSIFKKIEGHGAGRLIEQVGLKGKRIGGAIISEKHANFILNTGNATAKDVKDLIELVEATVKKELGFTMTPEINFVGEFA